MVCAKIVVAFACVALIVVQTAKLPDYLPQCAEEDPEFDKCATASLEAALPHIYNGDPSFRIPVLDPLKIDEVKLNSGQLQITFNNITLEGLRAVKTVEEFHWDKEANVVTGKVSLPSAVLKGLYNIAGRILVLPISGEGEYDLHLENVVVRASFPMEFVSHPKGGRKLKFNEGSIKYTTTKARFNFENLFGDKNLSDNMNKLLNENWEAVLKDVGEAVNVALESVIRSIANGMFSKVIL